MYLPFELCLDLLAVNAAWLNDDHETKLWLLAGSRIRSLTEARGLVPPPPEVVLYEGPEMGWSSSSRDCGSDDCRSSITHDCQYGWK